MKSILRKVFILCMALTLVLSFTTTSFAAGTVTYDGNAQEFIFEPGSEYSPTDLFTDFKGLMPGEKVSQKIFVKNAAPGDKVVKIYLRSLGADETSEDFLSKLKLKVKLEGEKTLFNESPDEPGSLTEWTLLGEFFSGAEVDMDVTVQVPANLGNEYQYAVGHVVWQFKVEEFTLEEWEESHPSSGDTDKPEEPKPDDDGFGPQTGDNTQLGLYLGIAGVSILLLIILLVMNRKKDKDN